VVVSCIEPKMVLSWLVVLNKNGFVVVSCIEPKMVLLWLVVLNKNCFVVVSCIEQKWFCCGYKLYYTILVLLWII
jgi:hypothetical protein